MCHWGTSWEVSALPRWGWGQSHVQRGGELMLAVSWGESRRTGHQLHRGHTGGFSQSDLAYCSRVEEYVG